MNEAPQLVTVYRSMDETAKQDCEIVVQVLTASGLSPVTLDDTAPDVPEGVFEVQVPEGEVARAEQILKDHPLPDEVEEVDDSSDLDLETIYHAEGNTAAQMEAMGLKNLLESNGIAAVIVGDSVLPNFAFEVRVAREQAQHARQVIAEAARTGWAEADRAEQLTERGDSEEVS